MRAAALILASAAVLAACSPPSAPTEAATQYRLEANIAHDAGSTIPVVWVRDGARQRMEFTDSEGHTVIITNSETGETLMMRTADGETMAMRLDVVPTEFQNPTESWQGDISANATRTGSCSQANHSGDEWSRTEEGVTKTACVTDDGIILRATEGDRVTWETTSLTRGAQPADQFELPAGVEVMDAGAMRQQAIGAPGAQPGGDLCQTMRANNAPPQALAQMGC